jgi:hypothetical protein
VSLPPDGGNLSQPPTSYRYGDIVVPFVAADEPLAVQDKHFVDCMATGVQPLTDGANGLAVVETLEAAELSRRLGRPVLLEEVRVDSNGFRSIGWGNGHRLANQHANGSGDGSAAASAPSINRPSSEAV